MSGPKMCPACKGEALVVGFGGVSAYMCCRGGVRDPIADVVIANRKKRAAEASAKGDTHE